MIRGSGLISGLDTQGLISQLMTLERQPITRLESQQRAFETEISALGSMSSAMSALQTLLEDFSERSGVLAFEAVSGDDTVFTASADGSAVRGSYDVSVSQLARAEKDRSASFASEFAEVTAGTLDITVFGQDPVSIDIAEGASLSEVRDAINSSGANVSASLIDTGNGVYLSLTADDSGHTIGGTPSDAIVISETSTGASGQALGLTEVQTAQNALLNIDGLDIERTSNTLTDVLSGVTVDLVGTSGSAVALTVEPSGDGVAETLQGFIDKYNAVISAAENGFDGPISTVGSGIQSLEDALRSPVPGLAAPYNTLASIGIDINQDTGQLSLDGSTLEEALATNSNAVADLFATDGDGLVAQLTPLLELYTDSTTGLLKQSQDGLNRRIDTIERRIDQKETQLGRREQALIRQFTALETLMVSLQSADAAFLGLLGTG